MSKTRACSLGPYDPDPAKCGQMRDVALVGGGAGSGGSVWIEADVIEGEGIISANGGSTTPTKGRATTDKLAVTSPGGAGGGGRLAIYYNTLARDKLKLQAMGGRSLEGTAYGTAGTIYLSSTQTYTEELRFDNAHSRLVVTWPGSPLPEAKAAAPLQRLVVTGSANVWIPAVGNAFTSVVVGELTVESKSKIGGKRVILLSEVIKVRDGSQLFGSDLRVSALTVEIDGKTSLITATAAGLAPAAQNGADAAGVEGGGGGGMLFFFFVKNLIIIIFIIIIICLLETRWCYWCWCDVWFASRRLGSSQTSHGPGAVSSRRQRRRSVIVVGRTWWRCRVARRVRQADDERWRRCHSRRQSWRRLGHYAAGRRRWWRRHC